MKTVWLSALGNDQAAVAAVRATLTRYGLACKGHFWVDAPEKMAWKAALDELLQARADLWLVLVDAEQWAKPSLRYGLALFAATLAARRGAGFPIVLLDPGSGLVVPDALAQASVLPIATASWPAKLVAKANLPAAPAPAADYRFDVLGDEQLGQWFEIGPRAASWPGVVFGVAGAGAKINFQAVGPAGALPAKTVLEYAQQGLQLKVGEREFTAWAVRNALDEATSYYARVEGCPEALLLMPYAESDEAEASVLRLV